MGLISRVFLQSQYALGHIRLVQDNYEKAFGLFKKASQKGNGDAQLELGKMYYKGQGVKKNLKKAVELFKKAADQKVLNAQYNLGKMYFYGEGVKQNKLKAKFLLLEAFNNPNCSESAKEKIKNIFNNNEFPTINKELLHNAKSGNIESQYKLGTYYHKNNINYEAFKWIKRAAKKGHAKAQFNLGLSYYYGKGIEKNKTKAESWMKKVCNNKNASNLLKQKAKKYINKFDPWEY